MLEPKYLRDFTLARNTAKYHNLQWFEILRDPMRAIVHCAQSCSGASNAGLREGWLGVASIRRNLSFWHKRITYFKLSVAAREMSGGGAVLLCLLGYLDTPGSQFEAEGIRDRAQGVVGPGRVLTRLLAIFSDLPLVLPAGGTLVPMVLEDLRIEHVAEAQRRSPGDGRPSGTPCMCPFAAVVPHVQRRCPRVQKLSKSDMRIVAADAPPDMKNLSFLQTKCILGLRQEEETRKQVRKNQKRKNQKRKKAKSSRRRGPQTAVSRRAAAAPNSGVRILLRPRP